MTAQILWQVWAAGMCLCLLAAAVSLLYYLHCRRELQKFSRILDDFEKEGKTEQEDYRDTMESKLLSRLKGLLHRAELQKEQAGKEKEEIAELLSDISHQLKTPLANILLNTDILESGRLTREEEKEFLQRNKEQARKMQWLMKTLVKASRIEQGIVVFESYPAPLKATLAQSISGVYALARQKHIIVETAEFEECMPCHNPKWTAEAIGNILENAVKYSPEHSRILIEEEPLEMYVKVKITDQGRGIPEAEYNQIFKRFYRGMQSREEEGNGLGLYLAQVILQSEKGYITVSSRKEGGACFSVFLLREPVKR